MKSHKQIKCPECKGSGVKITHYVNGWSTSKCQRCHGTGTISKPEEVKARKIEKLEIIKSSLEDKYYLGGDLRLAEKINELVDAFNNLDK